MMVAWMRSLNVSTSPVTKLYRLHPPGVLGKPMSVHGAMVYSRFSGRRAGLPAGSCAASHASSNVMIFVVLAMSTRSFMRSA